MSKETLQKEATLMFKIAITVCVGVASPFVGVFLYLFLSLGQVWLVTTLMGVLILPLVIPFLWIKNRKWYAVGYVSLILCFSILFGTQIGIEDYNRSITIDVTPNINVSEYLPFEEDSKIVKLESKTLSFEGLPKELLPVIDGASAGFPVYSAFVHAVYPKDTELYDGVFEYNTTTGGYRLLAEKETDLFIGAPPSKDQIAYAKEQGTEFKYTQIGTEAFVFFVHKDNPIESLTVEQIKGIYSGEITNWSQVGGNDEKIVPFQRDEGSGSQSMLIRFMGDTPIMEPKREEVSDGMGDIIDVVADYKNRSTSMGFSFRYYIEGIIKNPDIKMIGISGVAPTKENIKNGTYPIVTPVYAVTYENNPNPNVDKLIEWILSEEGQYIIEESGYVGLGK